MNIAKKTAFPLLLCMALLTGCSGTTQSDAELPPIDSLIAEEQPSQPETAPTYTGRIYYASDHGTVAPGSMTRLQAELEAAGNTWQADALAAVPATSDTILLLNAPSEDITQADADALDAFFDAGGHLLLVMPANEAPVRYKYLERVLEEYCIRMDYDLVTDAAEGHSVKDTNAVLMQRIDLPEGMHMAESAYSTPLLMDNVRSFAFFYNEGYGSIKMDALLETDTTAVGTPCGGTEEDPEVFENMPLMTMLYAYDDKRLNSSVVAIGSGDFLTDVKYDEPLSEAPRTLLTSSIEWMIWLNNR